ncbi:Tkl/drk protein kinase, variant, partial [Globisporangium polare]
MAVRSRRHQAARALAVALIATAVRVSPVAGALCSDTATQDAYASVLASTGVCEDAVGFTLEGTLTKTQTSEVCTTCTALAATTKSKALPTCNVKNSEGTLVTIQSLYDGFFACSSSSTSSSTSGSKSSDITPVPSPKTSSTPTPKTTNSTSTSLTPTTTPSSSSSGSGSSTTTPTPTTKKPSTTTKAPSTTKASSSTDTSSTSSTSSSSGSLSQSSQQPVTTHDSNTIVIIGVAVGVVVVVIIIATLCVCCQRRKNRTNKLNEVLLSPGNYTQQGSTLPGGNNTARSQQTGTGGGNKSSSASGQSVQNPQGGLWDDEAIIAARIPREKVVAETLLSRGGYGEVYRGV